MIKWESVIEQHVRGRCTRGELWIRLNRDGKVTGLYTMFGEPVKYVPETEEELQLEAMKVRAQLILETHEFAEELAKSNPR